MACAKGEKCLNPKFYDRSRLHLKNKSKKHEGYKDQTNKPTNEDI